MSLVAFLGIDTENWGQITGLIKRMSDTNIVLIKNNLSPAFPKNSKTAVIEVDSTLPMLELKSHLIEKLKKPLCEDFEVSLSLASG